MGGKLRDLDPHDLLAMADALNLELFVTGADRISGHKGRPVKLPALGLSLDFHMKVVSSRVSYTADGKRPLDIAVIVHVRGKFYILALYETGTGLVHIFVVDGGKVNRELYHWFESSLKTSLASHVQLLADSAVATFSKQANADKWTPGSELLAA